MTVTMAECMLLMYGNTFHYNESDTECKNGASGVKTMWILMQIELAVGYITLIRSLVTLLSIIYITIAKYHRAR